MSAVQVIVECWKNGKLLQAYPFTVPGSLAAPPTPIWSNLVEEAKGNLTADGLAIPPYDGITFRPGKK